MSNIITNKRIKNFRFTSFYTKGYNFKNFIQHFTYVIKISYICCNGKRNKELIYMGKFSKFLVWLSICRFLKQFQRQFISTVSSITISLLSSMNMYLRMQINMCLFMSMILILIQIILYYIGDQYK
jgi:hypothetical protein